MSKLKFIDLFAGIGGFRLALQSLGAECVFSSENNEHAIEMYEKNYGDIPYGDITTLDPKIIPDFDILCAGFPCQTFSIAGEKKGFEDATRGTLFFDICRILKEKRPKVFILENVKNLEHHDKGNTLFVMLKSLSELGYSVNYKILNARDFGVPQNRERIIIVGNNQGKLFDFSKIKTNKIDTMIPFLDKSGDFEILNKNEYTIIDSYTRQTKSGLIFIGYRNKKMRTVGVREGTEHLSRVHKQPNRIYSSEGTHPTLSAQEKSGRYFIYHNGIVRKLTLNECYRFMGFPENFVKVGSDANLYERIGNSVCVPMIKEVFREIENQFWKGENKEMTVEEYIESIYSKAISINKNNIGLSSEQFDLVSNIVEKEETLKGVFTVLTTSLVYKSLYPKQDVRLHQANMKDGYSGRSFDTKYVTPFLKSKRFYGAMKESGWLTRSLEQNLPYDRDYPGKISNKKVKQSFLEILDEIEKNPELSEKYLLALFKISVEEKEKKSIELINPIERESEYTINEIIDLLNEHFYYKYKSRGASILPVMAIYSIYECIIEELKRFNNKKLEPLGSHTSSDRSSGDAGDIVVRDSNTNLLYEVVEVKFDIPVDKYMIYDAYKKIKSTSIQRYYILSTESIVDNQIEEVHSYVNKIKEEHGCQVIVNGIFPTIKYYLRLLEDTDKFLEKYIKNIENDTEINFEHKLAWNEIMKSKLK